MQTRSLATRYLAPLELDSSCWLAALELAKGEEIMSKAMDRKKETKKKPAKTKDEKRAAKAAKAAKKR